MHIAVDQDDVCLDFIGRIRECFRKEFGYEGIPNYSGNPWSQEVVEFTKHPALLAAGYRDWWDWIRERDWLWGTADAVDGALGGLRTLRNRGHYLELITSKPRWAEPQVFRWLEKWRPPFQQVTIINSQNGDRKIDYTRADIVIDDKIQTCQDFADAGRMAVLFDPSLTHVDKDLPHIYYAASWASVLEVIDEAAQVKVIRSTHSWKTLGGITSRTKDER